MTARADFRDNAACRDYPLHWWFPTVGEHAYEARSVCVSCPVRGECLEFALTERVVGSVVEGIWASTNLRDRRALRRQRSEQATA